MLSSDIVSSINLIRRSRVNSRVDGAKSKVCTIQKMHIREIEERQEVIEERQGSLPFCSVEMLIVIIE
jgi:hypothetical protein